MTRPAPRAGGRSSAEAWPGRAKRSRPERAARQGGSGRRASRRARSRARKPSLGAGTPGGRAAGGHGRRRRAGRRLVRTRGAAGRHEDPRHRESPGRGPLREFARALVAGRGVEVLGGRGAVRDPATAPPPPALRESQRAQRGRRLGVPGQLRVPSPRPARPGPQRSVSGRCRFTWSRCLAPCRAARAPPPHNKAGPPPPADVFTMILTPPDGHLLEEVPKSLH